MFDALLTASAATIASEEHGHQLELLGMPTYWFAIIGFIIFGLLMLITVSFSGRGVVRPEHSAGHLSAEEETALRDYQNKRAGH